MDGHNGARGREYTGTNKMKSVYVSVCQTESQRAI